MKTTKQQKHKNMETKTKKYNYFYYGTPIFKANFVKEVPDNWEDEVINGAYSWGGYDAVEIEEDEY